MTLMLDKTLVGAYYFDDCWHEIPLLNSNADIIKATQFYSQRRLYLCGVFETPLQIGAMIFDNPIMLFLHGVRFNREDREITPIETIIDNAKMGI